jgi:hypothetical protein
MVVAILILGVLPFYPVPQNTLVSPISIFQQISF